MPKSRMRRCSPLEQKPVLLTRWPLPPDPTPRCQSRSRRRWQATERHRSSGWARYPSPLYANIPLDHLENLSGAPTSPIEAGTVHRQPAGAAACRRRVPRSADGHPLPWAGGDHDLPLVPCRGEVDLQRRRTTVAPRPVHRAARRGLSRQRDRAKMRFIAAGR